MASTNDSNVRSELAEIHHTLDTCVNLTSVLINGFLLYLIKFHSPQGMQAYRVLLAIDASLDFVMSIVMLETQPVILNGAGYFVFTCNGFFASLSRTADAWKMMLFTAFMHINVTWIPVQFAYRYLFLCHSGTSDRSRRVATIIAVVFALWNCIAVFEIYWMYHPPPTFQEAGLHSEWRLQTWIALWTVACMGSTAIVIYCEWKIVQFFRVTDVTHDRTKRLHKEFHRALLAMALVPLFTASVPIMYFMYTSYFELTSGPYAAFIGTAITSITLFNPMTTVFFMRCYRDVVLPCFKRKHEAAVSTSHITGLSLGTGFGLSFASPIDS